MSKYTTGEIAKLCGVSVRTVQYYDSRNILVPSELSEGGRRLYSEQDLKRMKIICFLRDAGISINNIGELLSEDDPGSVISVLLEQQEQALREEVSERQEKLAILDGIKKELRGIDNFSVESIGDIAYAMENKKNMQKLHAILLITGIPLGIIQWTSIVLWITMGIWWPFAAYWFVAIPYAVWVSNFYFKRVVYICPQCHEVFKPNFKEAFWARHTPTLRKLTCTCCGYHGFCVETYGKEEKENGKIMEFLPFFGPVGHCRICLLGYTLHHILTHKDYKRGNRTLWLIITIVLMNFVGPIMYFLLGKEDA